MSELRAFGDLVKEFNSPVPGAYPAVLTHAEADTLYQAFMKSASAKEATLYVDRELCDFCAGSLKNLLPINGVRRLNVFIRDSEGFHSIPTIESPK